jgi:hypothetical protein
MSASDKNLSTEYQPKGSATNLSDTLDRQGEQVPAGQRQWAADSASDPTDAKPEPLAGRSRKPATRPAPQQQRPERRSGMRR